MYSRSHQQKRDYKKCSIIVQKPFRRANINNGAIPPGAKGANKFLEMPNVQSSVNKGHLWQNIHDIESMAGGIDPWTIDTFYFTPLKRLEGGFVRRGVLVD